MRKPRNIDPAVNTARARYAAQHKNHPGQDHSADKRELVAANIAAYLKKTLAAAPPLTDEQRAQLAELLAPARQSIAQARIAALDADGGAP
jgi:hypothetical protein